MVKKQNIIAFLMENMSYIIKKYWHYSSLKERKACIYIDL